MYDEEKEEETKGKSKVVPVMLAIMFGVVLVSALVYVGMSMGFTKTLHVWWTGEGEEQEEIVLVSGDIESEILNCNKATGCSTSNIALTNMKEGSSANCVVTTTTAENITPTYSDAELEDGNVDVVYGTPFTFQINYDVDGNVAQGDYEVDTTIVCTEI